MESRKRKLPARSTRESASKKRTTTPPEPRTQPSTPLPAAPVQESLPKKVHSGEPLPTVATPQPDDLSRKDYQSIAESGVLADSLQRSRAKWLSEGIFEKYWTKPTAKLKKNGELANNPPKETMTKLGTCQIHVEPHIIEAQMFGIKELGQRSAVPAMSTAGPAQPMYRPIIQYGPPNGVMPPPPPKILPPQPVQQAPTRPLDTHMKNSGSPAPTSNTLQQSNGAGFSGQTAPNTHHTDSPQPSNAKSTDPVIQMLAERAATDPALKDLMKIVANGQASAEELKKFQKHIDELTRLQKVRQAANQHPVPPPPNQYQHSPVTATSNSNNLNARPSQSPAPSMKATATTTATLPPQPQYQPQPQALRSKGPVAVKSEYSGIVFEFTGGSGDRFLFPNFSVLDYRNQGEVIASFLIVRKGSASDSPTYDPALDYYQPMTIRLYAHQGRQLDALQKVVAPPEEVRRYMDDIMDNMTRAEYVLLAMRLPKEKEEPAEKEDEPRTDQMENQVLWATTHPTSVPHQVGAPKEIPTEGAQYQTFINSVAEKAVI